MTEKAKEVLVVLTRDYWVAEDQRVAAGTTISVALEAALDMIEAGLAKRPAKE